MGRFGHASSVFEDVDKTVKILIHGGYNAPFSGYSYSISDELLVLSNYSLSLFSIFKYHFVAI